MTDEEKKAKAIQDALEAGERKKADANTSEKLNKLLTAMDAMRDEFGKRIGALEAGSDLKGKGAPEPLASDTADTDLEMEKAEDALLEADARADAAFLKGRSLEGRRRVRLGEAQYRADSAYAMWGQRAPAPLHGETVFAYRRRLLRLLQTYSAELKAVDLEAIADVSAFATIANKIYADAAAASKMPPDLRDNELRPIVRVDEASGLRSTEFVGKRSFIHGIKPPPRYVSAFRTPH